MPDAGRARAGSLAYRDRDSRLDMAQVQNLQAGRAVQSATYTLHTLVQGFAPRTLPRSSANRVPGVRPWVDPARIAPPCACQVDYRPQLSVAVALSIPARATRFHAD